MRPDVVRMRVNAQQDEKQREDRERQHRRELEREHLRQDLRILTGQDSWDKYLALVEAQQAPDREELAALLEQSARAEYEPAETIAERHFRTSVLRERIRARDECLRIPQELLAHVETPPKA